MIVACWQHI